MSLQKQKKNTKHSSDNSYSKLRGKIGKGLSDEEIEVSSRQGFCIL